MAKIVPGPMIASASGSIGGTVFSRNRGGAYVRNRSIPITSTTTFALAAKNRFSTFSAAWSGLTDAERNAWLAYSLQNPVTDTLGFPRNLTGHQSFVAINCRRDLAGDAQLNDPPIVVAPDGLSTLVLAADIGLGNVDITFTPTPLAATEHIWLQGAVTNSPGITFVENLYKHILVDAAASASPLDIQVLIEARLGTLIVGQKLFVLASVYDDASGLLSQPLRAEAAVITT